MSFYCMKLCFSPRRNAQKATGVLTKWLQRGWAPCMPQWGSLQDWCSIPSNCATTQGTMLHLYWFLFYLQNGGANCTSCTSSAICTIPRTMDVNILPCHKIVTVSLSITETSTFILKCQTRWMRVCWTGNKTPTIDVSLPFGELFEGVYWLQSSHASWKSFKMAGQCNLIAWPLLLLLPFLYPDFFIKVSRRLTTIKTNQHSEHQH